MLHYSCHVSTHQPAWSAHSFTQIKGCCMDWKGAGDNSPKHYCAIEPDSKNAISWCVVNVPIETPLAAIDTNDA